MFCGESFAQCPCGIGSRALTLLPDGSYEVQEWPFTPTRRVPFTRQVD